MTEQYHIEIKGCPIQYMLNTSKNAVIAYKDIIVNFGRFGDVINVYAIMPVNGGKIVGMARFAQLVREGKNWAVYTGANVNTGKISKTNRFMFDSTGHPFAVQHYNSRLKRYVNDD